MSSKHTNVLLITANVGSIFEDPHRMLKTWVKEVLELITRLKPDMLALHCQEVGGKNYEESMQYVNDFIKSLLSSEALSAYDKSRIFLDEDFTADDKFTALGNIYFLHESVKHVQIWDFEEGTFRPVNGREVLSGNIESVSVKEKAKFPKDFFPECRWSRKGFIRTRWLVNNSVLDLVNIHLFHDASNFVAMESSPSMYAGNRWRALNYTLDRFDRDTLEKVPLFIFGDFNFRLDTQKLVQRLTDNTTMHSTHGKKNELSQLVYKDSHNNNPVLTVEKKAFDYHDKHLEIFSSYHKWLHDYDKEVLILAERLHEFEINFPPSYPYSEDPNDGISFMKTRVPSWCDRILMSHRARDAINQSSPVHYNVIGRHVCMGDHKPVYLHCQMRQGTGKCPSIPGSPNPVKCRSISINGLTCLDLDLDQWNIHQNAQFQHEDELDPSFSRRMGRVLPGQQGKDLFRGVARDLVRAEGVIYAFRTSANQRRRRHSESESTDDEENVAEDDVLVTAETAFAEQRDLEQTEVLGVINKSGKEAFQLPGKEEKVIPSDPESNNNNNETPRVEWECEKQVRCAGRLEAPIAAITEIDDDYYESLEIPHETTPLAAPTDQKSEDPAAPVQEEARDRKPDNRNRMCPSKCRIM